MMDTIRDDAHSIGLQNDHFDDEPEMLTFYDWAIKHQKRKKIPHDEMAAYWHKWGGEYLDFCQREKLDAEDIGETLTGTQTMPRYSVHVDDWGEKRTDHLYSWHGLISYLYGFKSGALITIQQRGSFKKWHYDMARDQGDKTWEEEIPRP